MAGKEKTKNIRWTGASSIFECGCSQDDWLDSCFTLLNFLPKGIKRTPLFSVFCHFGICFSLYVLIPYLKK
jgi:hypothetical protein